jgi:hypothetical protein
VLLLKVASGVLLLKVASGVLLLKVASGVLLLKVASAFVEGFLISQSRSDPDLPRPKLNVNF